MWKDSTPLNGHEWTKPKKLFGSPFAIPPDVYHSTPIKKLGERDQNYVGVLVVVFVLLVVCGKLLLYLFDFDSISVKDVCISGWSFLQHSSVRLWTDLSQDVEVRATSVVKSAVIGTAVWLFSWTLVFLDSDVPGENPPTPFTPRRNLTGYNQHIRNSYSLAYLMTIVNGVAVFVYLVIS